MPKPYRWYVQPAPVGLYRSFSSRGWPELILNDGSERLLAKIASLTGTSYTPVLAKSENLCLYVYIYKYSPDGTRERRTIGKNQPFTTLKAAKEATERLFLNKPDYLPKSEK